MSLESNAFAGISHVSQTNTQPSVQVVEQVHTLQSRLEIEDIHCRDVVLDTMRKAQDVLTVANEEYARAKENTRACFMHFIKQGKRVVHLREMLSQTENHFNNLNAAVPEVISQPISEIPMDEHQKNSFQYAQYLVSVAQGLYRVAVDERNSIQLQAIELVNIEYAEKQKRDAAEEALRQIRLEIKRSRSEAVSSG